MFYSVINSFKMYKVAFWTKTGIPTLFDADPEMNTTKFVDKVHFSGMFQLKSRETSQC